MRIFRQYLVPTLKLYIDERLWVRILALIEETTLERGFYIVGSRIRDMLIAYEAFEFGYETQEEALIISNPFGRIYLANSLPIGLDLVGILHSHPFNHSSFPQPSSIDIELCREYSGSLVLTANPLGNISAILVEDNEIFDVPVIIKHYDDEKPKIFRLNDLYCVLPSIATQNERRIYLPRLYAKHIYKIYLMAEVRDNRIIPPKFRWIWVKQIYSIPHMIFNGDLGRLQYEMILNNPITVEVAEEKNLKNS